LNIQVILRGIQKTHVLADGLDKATEIFLDNNKSPSLTVGELDVRGSYFYLVLYWAQALIEHNDNTELKGHFEILAKTLTANEIQIISELNYLQDQAVDLNANYD